ncbi:MAG: serine/threonine protein phosphatase [Acetobacteraceae bacterium]|nr:serine/threonine protein phosphatase [Acetobacteraceae bacterium]
MIDFMLAPATLPRGLRVYAVGDVHGCALRLAKLHRLIREDLTRRPVAAARLIHLGDLIDRGQDSAGVLDLVIGLLPPPGLEITTLRGNHEQMALDALAVGDVDLWLDNGAAATLLSWGIPRHTPPSLWAKHVPPAHLAFLSGLPFRASIGGYFFVHAGVRPGVSLAVQSPEDMLWIREPFLSATENFGQVVVHGHTPVHSPEVHKNRINIDTGAVFGGPLTAAVLEEDRIGFLCA